MGKAKTRYVKTHYKEIKVRKDFYEELKRLAGEKGLSVPALIEEMFKQCTALSMTLEGFKKPPLGSLSDHSDTYKS